MYYASHIALVAALSTLALASPVEVKGKKTVTLKEIEGKKTFTIDQVEATRQQMIPPALMMVKTYAKFKASPPTQLKVAVKAIQAGTVQAMPESYDISYLCPVSVGGQTLNLNFDSGSSDLWVYSTLQASSQSQGHSIYDPKKSPNSASMVGSSWQIKYGDGSGAGGVVFADKVVVGSVTATSQAVEAATSVSPSFLSDVNNDGLLGLGFSNINTVRPTQQKTFFDSVKDSLALPLWTATLKKGGPGSYDFGYIDASKYQGGIIYTDVNANSGYWQFTFGGYSIGSGPVKTGSLVAIADTGTTLMYLPQDVVTAYWGQVSGAGYNSDQGGYLFPCTSSLPDFSIMVEGQKVTVPGPYMNYVQISQTTCFGGMQPNTGFGFSILGDIFLKSQFVVHSEVGGKATLGFAAQSDSSNEYFYECDD